MSGLESESERSKSPSASQRRKKRPYIPPKLTVHGDIEKITKSVLRSTALDNTLVLCVISALV